MFESAGGVDAGLGEGLEGDLCAGDFIELGERCVFGDSHAAAGVADDDGDAVGCCGWDMVAKVGDGEGELVVGEGFADAGEGGAFGEARAFYVAADGAGLCADGVGEVTL